MAARYERGLFDPDAGAGREPVPDHYVYVVASDDDVKEYMTSKGLITSCIAQLGDLIVFYDRSQISIEDDTDIALCEDTAARYRAYGWHVQEVEGGENVVGIEEAIANAKAVTDRPSFISLRTIIGYPAPTMMNTGKAHGAALGDEEVAAVKKCWASTRTNLRGPRRVITHTRAWSVAAEAHDAWLPQFEAWAKREPSARRCWTG